MQFLTCSNAHARPATTAAGFFCSLHPTSLALGLPALPTCPPTCLPSTVSPPIPPQWPFLGQALGGQQHQHRQHSRLAYSGFTPQGLAHPIPARSPPVHSSHGPAGQWWPSNCIDSTGASVRHAPAVLAPSRRARHVDPGFRATPRPAALRALAVRAPATEATGSRTAAAAATDGANPTGWPE